MSEKTVMERIINRLTGRAAKLYRECYKNYKISYEIIGDKNGGGSFIDNLKVLTKNTKNYYKKAIYIPGKLIPKNKRQEAFLNDFVLGFKKDDKLVLKDIALPFFKEISLFLYFAFIFDSLSTYLFDGSEEDLCKIHETIPSEGPYEYRAVRLEKGDIVIDAGANLGEFSALAGVKGCRAYAFEPIPYIFENYLTKTAELNPNITACPYALSDKKGELIFEIVTDNIAGSSFVISKKDAPTVTAQATDLDSFVHENNLTSVDFIKADIEGAERYMLMGARQTLKEFAPKISICTYHLPDDPKVLRELILDANPDYVIEERYKKMYAHVPRI